MPSKFASKNFEGKNFGYHFELNKENVEEGNFFFFGERVAKDSRVVFVVSFVKKMTQQQHPIERDTYRLNQMMGICPCCAGTYKCSRYHGCANPRCDLSVHVFCGFPVPGTWEANSKKVYCYDCALASPDFPMDQEIVDKWRKSKERGRGEEDDVELEAAEVVGLGKGKMSPQLQCSPIAEEDNETAGKEERGEERENPGGENPAPPFQCSPEIEVSGTMSLKALQGICLAKGLSTSGQKSELIKRYKKKKETERQGGGQKQGSTQKTNSPSSSSGGPKTRGLSWTTNEFIHMLHLLADPTLVIEVRKIVEGNATCRSEYDVGMGKQNPWQDPVAASRGIQAVPAGLLNVAFNSQAQKYELITDFDQSEYPLLAQHIKSLDPNKFHPRPGGTLRQKFVELQRRWTTAFENWNRTGQHAPKTFHSFCSNDLCIQYAELLSNRNDCSLFSTALTKTIQNAARTSSSSSSESESSSSRKRKKTLSAVDSAILSVCTLFVAEEEGRPKKQPRVKEDESQVYKLENQICLLQKALQEMDEGRVKDVMKKRLNKYLEDLEKTLL